jgi:hypothetical protein
MTPVGIGGPVLRVPRASFSGMRDHRPQLQQQQQQHHLSFSPHWHPRNANNNTNNGSGIASASAARRGSVGGYGYGYGVGRFSIGGVGGGSSSQQYDRFNGRDEQDLEVQEDEVDDSGSESYERRSQDFEAAKVS